MPPSFHGDGTAENDGVASENQPLATSDTNSSCRACPTYLTATSWSEMAAFENALSELAASEHTAPQHTPSELIAVVRALYQLAVSSGFTSTEIVKIAATFSSDLVSRVEQIEHFGQSTRVAPSSSQPLEHEDSQTPTLGGAVQPGESLALQMPAEIMFNIFSHLHPTDFEAARKTHQNWRTSSLQGLLLSTMFKRAGWWSLVCHSMSCLADITEDRLLELSNDFSREIGLSPGYRSRLPGERRQVALTQVLKTQLSELADGSVDTTCRSGLITSAWDDFLLVASGSIVFVLKVTPLGVFGCAALICPGRVLAMSIAMSVDGAYIAVLLPNRVAMSYHIPAVICKANSCKLCHGSPRRFSNVCSASHPPRAIAACPTRQLIAVGSYNGIELYWQDSPNGAKSMSHYGSSTPTDHIFFLPPLPDQDDPNEIRLISSQATSGLRECLQTISPRHSESLVHSLYSNSPYQFFSAMPVGCKGYILFVEPKTNKLYIGTEQGKLGPVKLSRAVGLAPPASARDSLPSRIQANDDGFGIIVVVAYEEALVLFTVPYDVLRSRSNDAFKEEFGTSLDWIYESGRDQLWHRAHFISTPISGVEFGRVGPKEEVVEILIDINAPLTISILCSNRTLRTWTQTQFDRPMQPVEIPFSRPMLTIDDEFLNNQNTVSGENSSAQLDGASGLGSSRPAPNIDLRFQFIGAQRDPRGNRRTYVEHPHTGERTSIKGNKKKKSKKSGGP